MRILIDLQALQTESRFRGIGRYSLALVKAIIRNADQHEIFILLNGEMSDTCVDLKELMSALLPIERVIIYYAPDGSSVMSYANNWLKRAAELMREFFITALTPDLVYVTSLFEVSAVLSIGLRKSSFLTACTLYDLIPLLNSDFYLHTPEIKSWYMDKIESLKRADLLLSISEYAQREAINALALDIKNVFNISSAHTDFFKPSKIDRNLRRALYKRLKITRPFLMFNSAFEHRKNVDRLIDAYAKLDKSLRDRFQLLLTGKVSPKEHNRIRNYIMSLKLNKHVILSGYLEDAELLILLNSTYLFIFPSMHEGFGLPALEAMACGAATIGSNNTSVPEVIGLQAALFDPFDVESIKNKISEVLTDDVFHQQLIKNGLDQAQNFSWESTAKKAVEAFETLYKNQDRENSNNYIYSADSYYQTAIEDLSSIPQSIGLPSDADLKRVAKSLVKNQIELEHFFGYSNRSKEVCWRLEGPFDSSYSLALLNRETARALNKLGLKVALHSTEGPGDFEPNLDFLNANPDLAKFYYTSKSQLSLEADVCSRNLYPPRINDMDSKMNLLHHFAWEESGFPNDWVNDFNKHLDGMTCLSNHVKKIMIDHGVKVPITVSGCGVDHWERIDADKLYRIKAKPFRFLHVSSCFPRKGADALLKAYGQAFKADDPVTLVIKTFANPHNEIHLWLTMQQKDREDYPDVLIIQEDLTQNQLKSLYMQCDVMVLPSRAEGFGLPLAEAMLSNLPVITTAWGGQLDFCNENTAWLVDYEFKLTTSHFELFNSVWAEPNIEHLSQAMLDVYHSPKLKLEQKIKAAQQHLNERNTWLDVTQRLINFTKDIAITPNKKVPNKVAWVSTWNVPCGIASYSKHLLNEITHEVVLFAAKTEHITNIDVNKVRRCWESGHKDNLKELTKALNKYEPNCIVIQFNYGLFDIAALGDLILKQINQGRVIVLMLHSTLDPVQVMPEQRLEKIKNTLAKCHRILVHSVADLNRLKALKLVEQVTLFPHGILDFYKNNNALMNENNIILDRKIILASYGFFLPHKGLLELIKVMARLIDMGYLVQLKMINAQYPINDSIELVARAKNMIESLNLNDHIQMITDYLSDEQCVELLKDADLLIYPYQETGESASGAVRYGLALGKPVMVTPIPIFDDVAEVVYQLPGTGVNEITIGIKELLDEIEVNGKNLFRKKNKLVSWQKQHFYSVIGKKLNNLLDALIQQNIQ